MEYCGFYGFCGKCPKCKSCSFFRYLINYNDYVGSHREYKFEVAWEKGQSTAWIKCYVDEEFSNLNCGGFEERYCHSYNRYHTQCATNACYNCTFSFSNMFTEEIWNRLFLWWLGWRYYTNLFYSSPIFFIWLWQSSRLG